MDSKEWTSFSDQLLELVSWKSGSPCIDFLSLSFSLSVPLLLRQNSHLECEVSPRLLTCQASKTHARGSPRRGTLCYSSGCLWPYVDSGSFLTEAFLAFYANQGIQPLSLLYSLNCKLFPSLSLNLYISLSKLSPLRITLDPPGLDPGICIIC